MYVVLWEPKPGVKGGGGGHQVALTWARAATLHRALSRALPEAECRIVPAEDHAAEAVSGCLERAAPGMGGIADARPARPRRRGRWRRGVNQRL